jgi:glycosyltransferase involved in cell wall biosynthesis
MARKQVRRVLGAEASTVVFLNVSNFRAGKRHAWLIETFSGLRSVSDWQLWLVGDGTEWSYCHKLAEKAGILHQIRMLGYCSDPCPYYAGADVAVSASIEDSLPNFLIEAQSAGLPVIASDVRGVGETFSNEQAGFLVPPDDRSEFLTRITALRDDHGMRESMGVFGARSARENFSGPIQAAKVLDVLEGLVDA